MIRYTFTGKVEQGRLTIFRRKEFDQAVLAFDGMQVEVTLEKKKKRRSLMQNAYYFGVLLPIIQQGLLDAGYRVGKEQTHDLLKSMFAKEEIVNESTGEIMTVIGSTANMTTVKMMDYFSEITQWAAEYLGVHVPAPNEQIRIEL